MLFRSLSFSPFRYGFTHTLFGMVSESQRQQAASLSFLTIYQYIWAACIVALSLRHLALRIVDRKRAYDLSQEPQVVELEKGGNESAAPISHRPTRLGRFNARLYHPISDKPWASCISPLRIFIVFFIVSVNIGFTLVCAPPGGSWWRSLTLPTQAIATDIRGKQSLYVNSIRE